MRYLHLERAIIALGPSQAEPSLGNLEVANHLSHPGLSWKEKEVVRITEIAELIGYPSNYPCHQTREEDVTCLNRSK